MHIRILGSAAGGGFPQWNCNCRNCRGVRDGSVAAQPRTQSS
ncbi:MAG: pyrroloquinoline quinone biosynthesis protein B, partial [Pseudomonas aeruginosa]|nr:pyrroloquinoline quinone biosynthesis protein B [Pseudomonas aeruginosa]HCL3801536.1 pyrroloquinoline quinone biosynthesis protein B [Pseudomonas aeruginosa]